MNKEEIEQMKKLKDKRNCKYCRESENHICEYTDEKIPSILSDIVKRKILQKFPNTNLHVPYWTSSHEYDRTNAEWGRTSIMLSPFNQSGSTHYFGVINLGIADAIAKVPTLPAATNSQEILGVLSNKLLQTNIRDRSRTKELKISEFSWKVNPLS